VNTELPNPAAEDFFSGALDRISRWMIAIAILGFAAALARFGWRMLLGLVLGAVVSYVNFVWLKRVVSQLADRITRTGERQSSTGVVLRFLLRYALMAAAAYAILSVSPASLKGLFAGLFLPVAAILFEAAYEVCMAVARGL
jgi:hypothetical protein